MEAASPEAWACNQLFRVLPTGSPSENGLAVSGLNPEPEMTAAGRKSESLTDCVREY